MTFPTRLDIPEDVLEIARVLEGAGYEAWCVGGAVRDTLLGEPNTDYDVATSATPEVVKQLFRSTVPVGERFGTVAVRTRRRLHEVTTFRRDVTTDGRHAEVAYGVSLDEDLARRDFTINAIAHHPLRHEWRDPFGGARDLAAKLIRAVGEPALRFREDYLRILRGLRFAARFGFEIDPATWTAMRECVGGLAQLSAERVQQEWFKGLRSARRLDRLIELWITSGAAAVWLPELAAAAPPAPHPDATSRTPARTVALSKLLSLTAGEIPRDPVLLTSLLTIDPVAALIRLKASNAEIARAAALVTGPAEPESLSPLGVRRWMAAVGEAADDLAQLWRLRHGAQPLWEPVMRGIRERGEPLTRRQLAVTGQDLREIGIPPGPRIGAILERLLARVVDDPSLNTRETLLAEARSLA
ncbi:MAG TPA: CCA tRNA nucleotidyltransferase [Gemmatimonadales bacterium]|nr:CCA tRNA nucleotidyltransferase [Gemmatimonadales bacterium]